MSDSIRLSFHGAAGTVTGSRHLLQAAGKQILLDAGLFQGQKKLRQRNWAAPAFDPAKIDHVLLSHTHIDHCGYLPRLVKLGLKAPIHLTPAANALLELMLLDSAKIQEEDAKRANRRGYSRHRPALPLYTTAEAKKTLELRQEQRYHQWLPLGTGLKARFVNSGHLLGASFLEMQVERPVGRDLRVVFSGDIGRFDVPLHLDPRPCPECDVLMLESTYGDRAHTQSTVADQLAEPLSRTLSQGGIVLIPAFAVGRSQQITLVLRRLMRDGIIPTVPIHIDSPMAVNATRIYSRFLDPRNVDKDVFEDGRLQLFPDNVHFHRKVSESKRLNRLPGPRIIISSSGMLTAGRVLHHLARLAPDPRNMVVLAGYQARGTRARDLSEGRERVKVHGHWINVRCAVESLQGLSGHADRDELLRWVGSAPRPPKLVFLVHGERDSATALATSLRQKFSCRTVVPALEESFDLEETLP